MTYRINQIGNTHRISSVESEESDMVCRNNSKPIPVLLCSATIDYTGNDHQSDRHRQSNETKLWFVYTTIPSTQYLHHKVRAVPKDWDDQCCGNDLA
jgi:hypothetical protein